MGGVIIHDMGAPQNITHKAWGMVFDGGKDDVNQGYVYFWLSQIYRLYVELTVSCIGNKDEMEKVARKLGYDQFKDQCWFSGNGMESIRTR